MKAPLMDVRLLTELHSGAEHPIAGQHLGRRAAKRPRDVSALLRNSNVPGVSPTSIPRHRSRAAPHPHRPAGARPEESPRPRERPRSALRWDAPPVLPEILITQLLPEIQLGRKVLTSK